MYNYAYISKLYIVQIFNYICACKDDSQIQAYMCIIFYTIHTYINTCIIRVQIIHLYRINFIICTIKF